MRNPQDCEQLRKGTAVYAGLRIAANELWAASRGVQPPRMATKKRYRSGKASRPCRSHGGKSAIRADHVNRHVVHRKVTILAERTNTLASEFTQSGTGHLRWKATATFWSGSDSGSIRQCGFSRCSAAKTTRRNPGGGNVAMT